MSEEPLRLFLVEDEEEVAFLTRLHLERAGYDVTVCRTGADALIVLGTTSITWCCSTTSCPT